MLVTFVVLLFLNVYSSGTSQQLIYQSKDAAMIEKCQLAAAEISSLEVLNPSTASAAVSQMGTLRVTRLVITNHLGAVMYDSLGEANSGTYALFPEVVQAMEGYDVIYCQYKDGTIQSYAATPVYTYGALTGCIYMMEYDAEQGALIKSLQQNVFTVTLVLELLVILFSVLFSTAFSQRFRRILTSMQIIREGDYSHRVDMGGQDELTLLGDEFNVLTSKLQISENKRRQFVSDASHELKTPLASIKLLTDSILQNDMDMETVREFVTDIGNEADRLNRMSQKLLSLSRIESQQDGDCEIVFMAPTVERVQRMLSGVAEQNGVTLHVNLRQDSPILILEDDLYQITFNLVENGIKYNTPGGQVHITLLRQEDNAILQIRDTGVGIPAEALSHIFERFYRVYKARSRKSGGSGLGLAIVRNMVERNQGTIQVESTEGAGTTFYVSFPIFDTAEEDAE